MSDTTGTTTAPETGQQAAQAPASSAPAPTPAPTPGPPVNAPQAPVWDPAAWDGKVETLPEGAQKMIRDLRKDEGDERVAKKTLDAIMAAINPDAGKDAKPDPEQIAAELTAERAALAEERDGRRAALVELEVYRTASQHGANPAALTDSRAFLAKVQGLDPTAEDFTSKVVDAAKQAAADNPTLRAVQAASSSAADHAGGSGEGAISKAAFDAMSGAERNALFQSDPATYNRLVGRS